MDVSIIYVNYKTSELIINSINSVKVRTQGVSYEIIVVDNNSGDNSLEKINKAHQDVLCLASNENVGFGRANNIGIKQAKGRFILFLNPDTLLINNAIKHLKFFLKIIQTMELAEGIYIMKRGSLLFLLVVDSLHISVN